MKQTVNWKRPLKLAEVRNLSQADYWFREVSKNISPEVMQRIQNGTLTAEEKVNGKIVAVSKAWEKYLMLSGGTFIPAGGGTLHHPV